MCCRIRKGFKCHCGKSYKTCQGLRNHTATHHSGANLTTLTTQNGEVLQIPTSHVAALQPIRAIALKQISTANLGGAIGLPVKTIQGLVVATKPSESGNVMKGETGIEGNFDTITFAKGSTIQVAVPTLVAPPTVAGLVVNSASATITEAVATEQQTLTTALGVLTPATSPQTPPSDSTKSTAASLTQTTPVNVNVSPSTLPVMPVTPTPSIGMQLEFSPGTMVSSSPAVGTQTLLTPNSLISDAEATVVTQASSL